MTTSSKLGPGDFLPDFELANQRGTRTRLLSVALGRSVVVLFVPGGDRAGEGVLNGFAEHQERLAPHVHLLAVASPGVTETSVAQSYGDLPFPVLADPDGVVAGSYGLSPEERKSSVTWFLADANRRIERVGQASGDEDLAARLLDHFQSQAPVEPREVLPAAPVLVVPRVFDEAFCRKLMALYETGGNAPSGVFKDDYREAGGLLNTGMKSRRDHIVQDPETNNAIGGLIGRRVVPEIIKAFSFRVKYTKEFKIACYDAGDTGFFKPHRDNINAVGTGRRFAMTLNLNTGEYEGGHLRFPEYGPHLYRPAAGDAVVFACNLIHEAMPVTAGRRFVLLTFFYGPDGEESPEG